jgi:hypothetical protein
MGYSLQNQLAALFDSQNLRYDPQAVTEGQNKPDFVFPGSAEYHDANFDAALLVMLGPLLNSLGEGNRDQDRRLQSNLRDPRPRCLSIGPGGFLELAELIDLRLPRGTRFDLQLASHGSNHGLQSADVHIGAALHLGDRRLVDAGQVEGLAKPTISFLSPSFRKGRGKMGHPFSFLYDLGFSRLNCLVKAERGCRSPTSRKARDVGRPVVGSK